LPCAGEAAAFALSLACAAGAGAAAAVLAVSGKDLRGFVLEEGSLYASLVDMDDDPREEDEDDMVRH